MLYSEETHVAFVEPVTVIRTGKRGRPRKQVNPEFIAEALSSHRKITITKLARILNMDRGLRTRQLRASGVMHKFTDLSKTELDALVRSFRTAKPDSGLRYLIGHLRHHGLRIQKRRVHSSVHRVDGLGRILRQRHIIKRQDYKVSRPHALWHVDGHHKLILWGFVIHGFIDGFSRTVSGLACCKTWFLRIGQITALRASTNNKATTVLSVFLEAVGVYGLPSRVRADRGAENKKISVYMILARGLGRASFIWGSYVSVCCPQEVYSQLLIVQRTIPALNACGLRSDHNSHAGGERSFTGSRYSTVSSEAIHIIFGFCTCSS
jgi:hypothetical protein